MSHRFVGRIAALLPVLFLSACGETGFSLRGSDVAFPQNTGTQPPECQVKSITKLADEGQWPQWTPDGRGFYYSGRVNGTFNVFRMNSDGSNQQCLTCGPNLPNELRGKHMGWTHIHPSGKYVVFQAEGEFGTHSYMNTPGIGLDNDFWAMDAEGKKFWRLSRYAKDSMLQFPSFSSDGAKFIWSQRYVPGKPFETGKEYGLWTIKIADFVVSEAGPKFANVTELKPGGDGYYEPHGSTKDGKKIVFTGVLTPGKSQYYGEIFTYELATRKLTKIAWAPDLHFEQAISSPNGKRFSFMVGPFIGLLRFVYKTDIYLMDADGSNRVRLTYFNEPGHPEYTGADTLMDATDWSPDGTKLATSVYIHSKGKQLSPMLITFQGPCGWV